MPLLEQPNEARIVNSLFPKTKNKQAKEQKPTIYSIELLCYVRCSTYKEDNIGSALELLIKDTVQLRSKEA